MKQQGILLLSTGSKYGLVRIAKELCRDRGATLHLSDSHPAVPTRGLADSFWIAPFSHSEEETAEQVRLYCIENNIGLVIPTRSSDLPPLSKRKSAFQEAGIAVAVSGSNTIELCTDKLRFAQFLEQAKLPTPKTIAAKDFSRANPSLSLPLVAKPRFGSGGIGIQILNSFADIANIPEDYLFQEKAAGQEFTINCYRDSKGDLVACIPHQRLIVDGGEVVQAQTKDLPELIELAHSINEKLPQDAFGIYNIQVFLNPENNDIEIIELNPRIGGGYPLVHQAKGRFLHWLAEELLDRKSVRPFDNWTRNLTMMRYRDAVFELTPHVSD